MEKENLTINYDFEKNISSSIDAIKELKKEIAFKTELKGFPINNSIATSNKNINSGGFTVKFFIDDIKAKYIKDFEKIGVKENIILNRNGIKYSIDKNSTSKIELILSKPTIITIEVKNFQSAKSETFNNQHLRLVIPTQIETDFDIFECKSVKISEAVTFCALLEITLNNKSYHFYKYSNDDTSEKYLIIDSIEKNNFDEFKNNTSAIVLAFGFLTGNLFQDEYYYQIIKNEYSTIVEATAYYKKEPSVITHANLLNPREFEAYLEYFNKQDYINKISLRLKPNVFSNISEQITKNPILSRSIKLILEGSQTKLLLLKSGIYSIALETLTSFIYEKNKEKLKPIPNDELSKKVIKKLMSAKSEYESFISSYGNKILDKKIENINSPTNSKKLSKPFELYNIKLSDSELEILKHRNKFLHGTSPFDENDLINRENEIAYISKKLFTLNSILVLKYCGYKGYMVDYGGYHQLDWNDKVTEHLFKII